MLLVGVQINVGCGRFCRRGVSRDAPCTDRQKTSPLKPLLQRADNQRLPGIGDHPNAEPSTLRFNQLRLP
jgi:hypothetical protein